MSCIQVRNIQDQELDYDNWYVCANCGQTQVPLEGQEITLDDILMCPSCQEDDWLYEWDEPYL